jgi:hypothetical protein
MVKKQQDRQKEMSTGIFYRPNIPAMKQQVTEVAGKTVSAVLKACKTGLV